MQENKGMEGSISATEKGVWALCSVLTFSSPRRALERLLCSHLSFGCKESCF